MKKPILLGVEGESKELIEKYNAGLAFIPENKIDFLDKLKIMTDKSLHVDVKNGCYELALNFRRDYLANKMLDIIRKIF